MNFAGRVVKKSLFSNNLDQLLPSGVVESNQEQCNLTDFPHKTQPPSMKTDILMSCRV